MNSHSKRELELQKQLAEANEKRVIALPQDSTALDKLLSTSKDRIEALELRVARLVDALQKIADMQIVEQFEIFEQALAATEQDNQQWLREREAKVLEKAGQACQDWAGAAKRISNMVAELRSQPKQQN